MSPRVVVVVASVALVAIVLGTPPITVAHTDIHDASQKDYYEYDELLPIHLPDEQPEKCFEREKHWYEYLKTFSSDVRLNRDQLGADEDGNPLNEQSVWFTCASCFSVVTELQKGIFEYANNTIEDSQNRNFTENPVDKEEWNKLLQTGCKNYVQSHYLHSHFIFQRGSRLYLHGLQPFTSAIQCEPENVTANGAIPPRWVKDTPAIFDFKVSVCDKVIGDPVVSHNWRHFPFMADQPVITATCMRDNSFFCSDHQVLENELNANISRHYEKIRRQEREEFQKKQDRVRQARKERRIGRDSHRQAVLAAAEDAAEVREEFESKMIENLVKAEEAYKYNIEGVTDEEQLAFYKEEYEAERKALISEFEEIEEKLAGTWRAAAQQEREFE